MLTAETTAETAPISESLPPQPRRAPPRKFDWPAAAKLLALGNPAEQIAAAIGCDEARFWRQVQQSARFQAMVEKEVERNQLIAGLRLQALRQGMVEELASRRADLDPALLAAQAALPPPEAKDAAPQSLRGRLAQAAKPARAGGNRRHAAVMREHHALALRLRDQQLARQEIKALDATPAEKSRMLQWLEALDGADEAMHQAMPFVNKAALRAIRARPPVPASDAPAKLNEAPASTSEAETNTSESPTNTGEASAKQNEAPANTNDAEMNPNPPPKPAAAEA